MVTEDYVSFEVAKLLKEKGFNEDCLKVYINGELRDVITKESIGECTHCYNSWVYPGDGTAPTLQMAMKWLRETYKLHIEVEVLKPYLTGNIPSDRIEFYASIVFTDQWDDVLEEFKNTGAGWHSTYEKAVEAAIKYCLENLI